MRCIPKAFAPHQRVNPIKVVESDLQKTFLTPVSTTFTFVKTGVYPAGQPHYKNRSLTVSDGIAFDAVTGLLKNFINANTCSIVFTSTVNTPNYKTQPSGVNDSFAFTITESKIHVYLVNNPSFEISNSNKLYTKLTNNSSISFTTDNSSKVNMSNSSTFELSVSEVSVLTS